MSRSFLIRSTLRPAIRCHVLLVKEIPAHFAKVLRDMYNFFMMPQ